MFNRSTLNKDPTSWARFLMDKRDIVPVVHQWHLESPVCDNVAVVELLNCPLVFDHAHFFFGGVEPVVHDVIGIDALELGIETDEINATTFHGSLMDSTFPPMFYKLLLLHIQFLLPFEVFLPQIFIKYFKKLIHSHTLLAFNLLFQGRNIF